MCMPKQHQETQTQQAQRAVGPIQRCVCYNVWRLDRLNITSCDLWWRITSIQLHYHSFQRLSIQLLICNTVNQHRSSLRNKMLFHSHIKSDWFRGETVSDRQPQNQLHVWCLSFLKLWKLHLDDLVDGPPTECPTADLQADAALWQDVVIVTRQQLLWRQTCRRLALWCLQFR